MAQTKQLIDTLKRTLKAHGYTYVDVAKQLSLSQASVKRLFSEENFSLVRLDSICQMMEIEISDLVLEMSNHASFALSELTLDQEQEIASDIGLLLVTVCVLNRWKMDELIENFNFTQHQCIQYLAVLDRLKIIDLLMGNKIKLKIAVNFKWRDNGPIQQFFQQKLATDFFNSTFNQQQEKLIVMNGMLSSEAMAIFHRKLGLLAREFDELNNGDSSLPLTLRRGSTVVLATRCWEYGLFDKLRK